MMKRLFVLFALCFLSAGTVLAQGTNCTAVYCSISTNHWKCIPTGSNYGWCTCYVSPGGTNCTEFGTCSNGKCGFDGELPDDDGTMPPDGAKFTPPAWMSNPSFLASLGDKDLATVAGLVAKPEHPDKRNCAQGHWSGGITGQNGPRRFIVQATKKEWTIELSAGKNQAAEKLVVSDGKSWKIFSKNALTAHGKISPVPEKVASSFVFNEHELK